MVMNIFTSFFSLCYGHRAPCQHCRLQSSPQTLLQWLDTPAFQRKGPLEKAKEWLPLLVDRVLWGYCLPVWLSFNLLAGINPSLLVWSFSCCLCGRAGAGTASCCTSAHPQGRKCHVCFIQTVGAFHSLDSSVRPLFPHTGLRTTALQGRHLQRMTGPCSQRYSVQPYAQHHPVLRENSGFLCTVIGLRACFGAWLHSSSSSSGEFQVLAYLLLPRKLSKADVKSRPNANNI